jgi:hypothetical protein
LPARNHQQEHDMTTIAKAGLFTVGLALAIMAGGAQSSAAKMSTNLSKCTSSSRLTAEKCCEKAVSADRLIKMSVARESCRAAVVCGGRALRRKCYVENLNNPLTHGKETPDKGRAAVSDIRLKTDIHRIGTTVLNLPLYSFEYKDQPGTYVGVMAQDVLKVKPSAVSIGSNGYYMVDYGKLGIVMERVK